MARRRRHEEDFAERNPIRYAVGWYANPGAELRDLFVFDVVLDVPLNAAGVDCLNDASGEVVFGGAITTLTKGAEDEYLFNSTGATNVRELIVRVE